MLIEPQDMDPFTIRVDPRHDSIESMIETVAKNMNMPRRKLRLQFDGKNITEKTSLTKVFLRSRKPVVKAITADMDINIIVHLPSKEVKKVRISWFARVDDLKKLLQIPTFRTLLKVNNKEIDDSARFKQLIDVGVKDGSEITVTSSKGVSVRSLK